MICLAALMYVLTGGSSVGKTSIIKELEKRSEHVIHEAATDVIISKINDGVHECWKEEEFVLNILKLQLEREAPYFNRVGRVFVDRGVLDHYAYIMPLGLAGTKSLSKLNELLNGIDINTRYTAVFFVLPHSNDLNPVQTELKRENSSEIRETLAATYAIYCRHKNFIEVPGWLTPEERAQFVLEHVERLENQLESQLGA